MPQDIATAVSNNDLKLINAFPTWRARDLLHEVYPQHCLPFGVSLPDFS
jgi:hypothetical protein